MPTRLDAARQRLGYALGFYLVSTTSAAASSATEFTCSPLIDSDAGDDKLAHCYAMPTSTTSAAAGEVRRIQKSGFTPATGKVACVAPFSTTLSSGVVVEISGTLPQVSADGKLGLRECLNRGLSECWDVDTLSITPSTASVSTYSLTTTAPWISDEDDVIDVYYRRSGSTADDLVPEWRLNKDLDGRDLEIRGVNLSTSDTLKPRVYRPLDTWIETAGTWATSTAGLVNDSDRCLLDPKGLELVGKAYAYEVLATQGDVNGKLLDEAKAKEARLAANDWKLRNLPRERGRAVHWDRPKTTGPLWPNEGSLG